MELVGTKRVGRPARRAISRSVADEHSHCGAVETG